MKKKTSLARALAIGLLLLNNSLADAQNRIISKYPIFYIEYDESGNIVNRKQHSTYIPGGPLYFKRKSPKLTVSPNPTSGIFTVVNALPSADEVFTYNLYSINSILIESRQSKEQSVRFDISKYAEGIYLLQILGTDYESTWKIVKQ